MDKEKTKCIKIDLNNIERIKYKVLIDRNISHGELNLVINEEQNYFRLKKRTRQKDNQLSDIEHDGSIEHVNKIRQNERQSIKLKIEV